MAIQVLDTQTANRIAAGEVVERPASIVKELCENALDAGATSISVEILGGGIERIRITDNGCGMTPEDLALCLRRHATSKIRSGDPLTDIHSLGFRGEALPSIASVSRLSIASRTRGAEAGAQLTCEGGGDIEIHPYGCPEGTQVSVADLFYNTPARRAFLKRPATEAGAVADVVTAVLLGNPGVAVQFTNQRRTVFASPGDGKLQSAVRCALGAEAAARMIPVKDCRDGVAVEGLVGVADLARANRSGQMFFVNGRPVRSLILQQALEYACGERVTTGRFAQCVLSVIVENAAVDVNVHPNKLEVRFREEERVRLAVADAVRDALLEAAHRERFMGMGMPGAGQSKGMDAGRSWGTDAGRGAGEAREVRRPASVQQSMMEPGGGGGSAGGVYGSAGGVDRAVVAVGDSAGAVVDAVDAAVAVGNSAGAVDGSADAAASSEVRGAAVDRLRETLDRSRIEDALGVAGDPGTDFRGSAAPMTSVGSRDAAMPEGARQDSGPQRPGDSRYPGFDAPAGAPSSPSPAARPSSMPDDGDAPMSEPDYALLGVFQSTYLVVTSGDSVYYIDQHAAHERILFDRFMADYDSGAISQPLLAPIVLNLSLRERAVVLQNAELLADLGFELEAVGEGMFLRAVPHILGQPQAEGFFREWLDRLEEWRPGRPIEMRREAVIKLACRKAIKAGDPLSDGEARALIRRMLRGDVITCPHGRPVYLRVTVRELEKRFGRA